MSFITQNPDIDRLAARALQTGFNRRTNLTQPDFQPPQLERPFGSMEGSLTYGLGERLSDISNRRALLQPFGRYLSALGEDNNGAAALLGALGGGAAGAGFGYLRGQSPLAWGLGGAAAGGLGSYLIGNAMASHRQRKEYEQLQAGKDQEKSSSFYAMDDESQNSAGQMQDIQSKLFADYSAPGALKTEIFRLLQSLDPREISEVHSLIRGSAGAGMAFIIARFLLGAGIGTSTLMALIGGAMGMMSRSNPVNAFGQRTDTSRNVFGEHRLV